MRFSNRDIAAIAGLIDTNQALPVFVDPPSRRSEESQMQQELVRWWDCVCGQYGLPAFALMSSANQGARNARNGARMKKEGMRKGCPDLFISVPRGTSHGLYLELKTLTGVLSKEQKDFLKYLSSAGYVTCVARTYMDARNAIEHYLKNEDLPKHNG